MSQPSGRRRWIGRALAALTYCATALYLTGISLYIWAAFLYVAMPWWAAPLLWGVLGSSAVLIIAAVSTLAGWRLGPFIAFGGALLPSVIFVVSLGYIGLFTDNWQVEGLLYWLAVPSTLSCLTILAAHHTFRRLR